MDRASFRESWYKQTIIDPFLIKLKLFKISPNATIIYKNGQ